MGQLWRHTLFWSISVRYLIKEKRLIQAHYFPTAARTKGRIPDGLKKETSCLTVLEPRNPKSRYQQVPPVASGGCCIPWHPWTCSWMTSLSASIITWLLPVCVSVSTWDIKAPVILEYDAVLPLCCCVTSSSLTTWVQIKSHSQVLGVQTLTQIFWRGT